MSTDKEAARQAFVTYRRLHVETWKRPWSEIITNDPRAKGDALQVRVYSGEERRPKAEVIFYADRPVDEALGPLEALWFLDQELELLNSGDLAHWLVSRGYARDESRLRRGLICASYFVAARPSFERLLGVDGRQALRELCQGG